MEMGEVVNDCTMVLENHAYLSKYKLTYEAESSPIIAVISHDEFKECLEKVDSEFVLKLINFGKSIPGF